MSTRTFLGIVGLSLLVACGSDDAPADGAPSAASNAPPSTESQPAGTPDYAVEPGKAPVVLRAKAPASFEIAIARSGGFAGDVTIEIAGLPANVKATVIQPGSGSKASVTLEVEAAVTLGDSPLTIRARAGDLVREGTRPLIVAGLPGSLDKTFNKTGVIAGAPNSIAFALRVDETGRGWVAGGGDLDVMDQKTLLARYTATGAPDASWGPDGVRLFQLTPEATGSAAWDVVFDANGLPVLGGAAVQPNRPSACIARLGPDGEPDLTFGEGGSTCVKSVDQDRIQRLAALPDGSIIGVGIGSKNGAAIDMFLVKLTKDGQLDKSFASGFGLRGYSDWKASPNAMSVDSQGRIVVAGSCDDIGTGCVLRFLPDGAPDTSFRGGRAPVMLGSEKAWVNALQIGPNDEIYLAGGGNDAPAKAAIIAIDASGEPLEMFGTGGWKKYGFGDTAGLATIALADGQLIAGGVITGSATGTWGMTRADLLGNVDPSLLSNGFPVVAGSKGTVYGMGIAPGRAVFVENEGNSYNVYRTWR